MKFFIAGIGQSEASSDPLATSSTVGTGKTTKRKRDSEKLKCPKKHKPNSQDSGSSDQSVVLESFNHTSGSGDVLKELLPDHLKSRSDAVAAFIFFINERQKIFTNKRKGRRTLTNNPVLANQWFTNIYREADRGTMYFRHCINQTDLAKAKYGHKTIDTALVTKILFKSLTYRLINKIETFTDFGTIPDLEDFPTFLELLERKKSQGKVIFTAAHQNMGYDKLLATLKYVAENIDDIAKNVIIAASNQSLEKCMNEIMKIRNVGNFFAWQILCDLLETNILGPNSDDQWVWLGPGAKDGLERVFPTHTRQHGDTQLGLTRLLRNLCALSGPMSSFNRLGLNFPAFLNKPLSLKNVEHALCEYDKYFRYTTKSSVGRNRKYSIAKSRNSLDRQVQCGICDEIPKGHLSATMKCLLCGTIVHKACDMDWLNKYYEDGSWLCSTCHISERIWNEKENEEKYQEGLHKNDTSNIKSLNACNLNEEKSTNPFKCLDCDKTFQYSFSLKKHSAKMSCKRAQWNSITDKNNTISKDSIQNSDLTEIAEALEQFQEYSDSDSDDDEDMENDIYLSIENEKNNAPKNNFSLACHVCNQSVSDFDELEYHMGKVHDNVHLKSKVCQ